MASLQAVISTCSLRKVQQRSLNLVSSLLVTRKVNDVPITTQVRTATKKAAGSVKRQNHNKSVKGKRLGPKVVADEFVQPGAILFRQKGFRMHPGRNVDHGRDHTLFALREGHVKITKELVQRSEWCSWGEGPYFERTFMHVEERLKARRIVCKNPESLRDFML